MVTENLSQWIADDELDRLHPIVINEPGEIRTLLARVKTEGIQLERGTNRKALSETATIERLAHDELTLATREFRKDDREQVFLRFNLAGRPYFFSSPQRRWGDDDLLTLELPAVVYVAERRDRPRHASTGQSAHVSLDRDPERGEVAGDVTTDVELADLSADGLSVRMPATRPVSAGDRMRVRVPEGWQSTAERSAEVCWVDAPREQSGWKKIGLRIVPEGGEGELEVDHRDEILGESTRLEAAPAEPARTPAERVHFHDARGEKIACLVDRWGDPREATAIVIPPAWGLTKETLMPLAKTLVETFAAAGEAVAVVRFDGIRKRGESSNDPECEAPGHENLNYTFRQGVSDILSTSAWLDEDPATKPARKLLVSFSMASIESRKALATGRPGEFAGWVSVVGSPDPQSLMRVISGGLDYLGGAERGVSFGKQDVQGLLLDIDRASRDAIEGGIAFLSDARDDFAKIAAPITWIHGRYDAWNELARIRGALSFGDTSHRRLIEIPTGHQLKTSFEALQTFGLVAQEALRIATGVEGQPVAPHADTLRSALRSEKSRLVRKQIDLRSFWKDYLLGRDGHLGIELVTQTQAFRELMHQQIAKLELRQGQRLIDLGSGAGSAPLALLELPGFDAAEISVTEVDYVTAALRRTREHIGRIDSADKQRFGFVAADLSLGAASPSVPLKDESADRVLASLLLNYLSHPQALLAEMYRVLRPGGRLVLSSLRPDADVSTICVSGVAELRTGLGREVFGAVGERKMNESLRDFINDAGRLLDLEERGYFHFWEPDVLREMADRAGFAGVELAPGYGTPPQAWVLSARRE